MRTHFASSYRTLFLGILTSIGLAGWLGLSFSLSAKPTSLPSQRTHQSFKSSKTAPPKTNSNPMFPSTSRPARTSQPTSRQVKVATQIYLIRHAEKAKDGKRNPPLTPNGHKRAQALIRILHDVPIHAFFSTPYKRTQQTIAPLALTRHKPIFLVKPHAIASLVQRIKTQHQGQTVVVSGHSNTIPKYLHALGFPRFLRLHEATDYDNLFLVVLPPQGSPTFIRLHVGPPPPRFP